MKTLIKIFLTLGLLAVLGLMIGWAIARGPAVEQPIQFNHKSHMEAKVNCVVCHTHVEDGATAGRPGIDICAMCHAAALGKSQEELKVVEAVTQNREIPWRRLYQLPAHVRFSHSRHVTMAKLECSVCHGDIGTSQRPLERAPTKISMDQCMECHRRSNTTQQCTACHK